MMIQPHALQTLLHLYPGLQSFLPFVSGGMLVGFVLTAFLVWKLDKNNDAPQ